MSDDIPNYDLSSHPEYASQVGQITAAWGGIESRLFALFTWMMQCWPTHSGAAYYALQNNKARTDMVRALIPLLHSDEEKKAVTHILSILDEAASIRNRFCHAKWVLKGGKVYIETRADQHYIRPQFQRIKLKELKEKAETVCDSNARIGGCVEKLSQQRPIRALGDAVPPSLRRVLPKHMRDRRK